jgi:hypothetical protein
MRVVNFTPRTSALPVPTPLINLSTVALSVADTNGFSKVGVSGLPDNLIHALDLNGTGQFKVLSDMDVRKKVLILWPLYLSGASADSIVARSVRLGGYGRSQTYAFLSIARTICPSPIGMQKRF